jgi:protein O-GlcNAc transferase
MEPPARSEAPQAQFAEHARRARLLEDERRYDEALASLDAALAVELDDAETLYNRGNLLRKLRRYDEALRCYDRLATIAPGSPVLLGVTAEAAIHDCDWKRVAELTDRLCSDVVQRRVLVSPFTLLGYCSDPEVLLRCAQRHVQHTIPELPPPLSTGKIWSHTKPRIAYLSADFRNHAVGRLVAELFELHDRSRFEVVGISFGRDDQSSLRARISKAFDQFHDVKAKSDRGVAALMHALEIDIAVDLMGYTTHCRTGILAHRPAPIQVNYLGFPGTMGAPFMDYIIADPTVLPVDHQPFYMEKIVHLPDCYQVNDTNRQIAGVTPSKRDAGLPETGFVFCCFNNNYKITAPIFDIWMRLLHTVEGSVLWLLRDSAGIEANLRKEAAARGIDPARLVFAGRLPHDQHLARHRLADLLLDTLPYNAHTTASDALWAGLPFLTCCGTSFAGRVAASLLHAVGLSELVTHDLAA